MGRVEEGQNIRTLELESNGYLEGIGYTIKEITSVEGRECWGSSTDGGIELAVSGVAPHLSIIRADFLLSANKFLAIEVESSSSSSLSST